MIHLVLASTILVVATESNESNVRVDKALHFACGNQGQAGCKHRRLSTVARVDEGDTSSGRNAVHPDGAQDVATAV